MATQKNAIVTLIDAGTIVRPNEYLGTVKNIEVNFAGDYADGDTLVFSDVLSQNTKFVGLDIKLTQTAGTALGSGMTFDFGVTGDADSIIDGQDMTSALSVTYRGLRVDVGGKALVGTVKGNWPAAVIQGKIEVVQDM